MDSIESFEISADNSVFLTVNGVLYSKDGSVLIAYPKSKTEDRLHIAECSNNDL